MSEAGAGFIGHVVDDGFEVAFGFFEDFELAVGAGAGGEDFADAVDGFAAAEFVDYGVDEGEIFLDEVALGDFLLAAEVDERAIEAVADGAEFVFHQAEGARTGGSPDWTRGGGRDRRRWPG